MTVYLESARPYNNVPVMSVIVMESSHSLR